MAKSQEPAPAAAVLRLDSYTPATTAQLPWNWRQQTFGPGIAIIDNYAHPVAEVEEVLDLGGTVHVVFRRGGARERLVFYPSGGVGTVKA